MSPIRTKWYSITVDELSFTEPFMLTYKRNGYIQAFVTFFNIDFICCHKPTGFPTGTDKRRYAHRQQTVFHPDNGEGGCLTVKKGEQVTGSMSTKPNARNNHDLDNSVKILFEVELSSIDSVYNYQMH